MKISSKLQFLDLYLAGALGNRFRIWRTYQEALRDKPEELGLRELGIGAGTFEMVKYEQIESASKRWLALGRRFYLNASDIDHLDYLLIQGEICRTVRGYEGYIGFAEGRRMRDMFKLGTVRNFRAGAVLHIMRTFMDANTLADVEGLFDLYPDATIEFATYSKELGVLPNRNTIIWEVRDY